MKRRDILLGITASVATIPSVLACENNLQDMVDEIIKDLKNEIKNNTEYSINLLQSVTCYRKKLIFTFNSIKSDFSLNIQRQLPDSLSKEQGYIIAGLVYEQIMDTILSNNNVWYPASNP